MYQPQPTDVPAANPANADPTIRSADLHIPHVPAHTFGGSSDGPVAPQEHLDLLRELDTGDRTDPLRPSPHLATDGFGGHVLLPGLVERHAHLAIRSPVPRIDRPAKVTVRIGHEMRRQRRIGERPPTSGRPMNRDALERCMG